MIRKLFIAVSILFSFVAQAQEENTQTPQNTSEQELSLENGKQYQIGGISVTGTKRYNAQTILLFINFGGTNYLMILIFISLEQKEIKFS